MWNEMLDTETEVSLLYELPKYKLGSKIKEKS